MIIIGLETQNRVEKTNFTPTLITAILTNSPPLD